MNLPFSKKKPTSPTPPDSGGAKNLTTDLSAKDIIAPESVTVEFNHLEIGTSLYKSYFVANYPRFVTANWLSPLINFDHSLRVSMFIYPVDSKSILSDLRRKIAEMEAEMSTDIQRGRIVNPSTQAKLEDALSLQDQLVKGIERYYQFGLYVTVPADEYGELNQVSKEVSSTLGSLLISAIPSTLEQTQGFQSTLPVCIDHMLVTRNEGIMYGLNEHNGSLVIFDRFSMENANSVVFAKAVENN